MRDIVQPKPIRKLLIVPVFLGLVGCAGTSGTPDRRDRIDPLFRVATLPAAAERREAAMAVSARGAQAFGIETRLVGAKGDVLMAPRITVYARRRANVTVINQTAYVENFEIELSGDDYLVDPIVGMLQSGVVLEVCVAADGDAAVLSYRARVSELLRPIPTRNLVISTREPVTVQLPKRTSSEVAGVRRVTPGSWTRLAVLGSDEGAVALHVRVVPADVVVPDFEDRSREMFLGVDAADVQDFAVDGGAEFALRDWLATAGEDLRVQVDAIVLDAEAPLGEVLDAALGQRYGLAAARLLRGMSLTSRHVPGATMRMSLDEAYVADYEQEWDLPIAEPRIETLRSGISATFVDGGQMEISWVTVPTWGVFTTQLASGLPVTIDLPEVRRHARTMRAEPGSWLVTLAHTPEGGTLAMLVSIGKAQKVLTKGTRRRSRDLRGSEPGIVAASSGASRAPQFRSSTVPARLMARASPQPIGRPGPRGRRAVAATARTRPAPADQEREVAAAGGVHVRVRAPLRCVANAAEDLLDDGRGEHRVLAVERSAQRLHTGCADGAHGERRVGVLVACFEDETRKRSLRTRSHHRQWPRHVVTLREQLEQSRKRGSRIPAEVGEHEDADLVLLHGHQQARNVLPVDGLRALERTEGTRGARAALVGQDDRPEPQRHVVAGACRVAAHGREHVGDLERLDVLQQTRRVRCGEVADHDERRGHLPALVEAALRQCAGRRVTAR